jgi:transcriptional regulator with XRE-family HTH domain
VNAREARGTTRLVSESAAAFGQLLSRWRRLRGKSQLVLAVEAAVSPRHVSFVETGRSKPSREMVLTLATALNVPLRDRNTLLLAAGYAPLYRETRLDAPELEPALRALDMILKHQEPYPAVVLDGQWDLLRANDAAGAFFSAMLGDARPEGRPNVLRLMFDERYLKPHVERWSEVAGELVQRVHREAAGGAPNDALRQVLREVLAYPGVPEGFGSLDPGVALAPFVPISFKRGDLAFRYFSLVATLGTPQDVTLQELRVECFFPADAETERAAARLLAERGRG